MRKALIFFLIIVIIGAAFWYWSSNFYSKETLRLEIFGPEEVGIAESFEYLVKYKSEGNVRLEDAKLIFEYPEHSIVEENLLRKEIELEDIYPGEERTHRFKTRLLGREGEAKTARVSLTYHPKNIRGPFESVTTFTTIIKGLPLTLRFDLPSEVEAGKETTFILNYFSNIDYPLDNLRIKVEYPGGFEFIESDPSSLEQVEWDIPSLNKAEGGRIEIIGKLRGEVGDQKVFKAEFGMWQEGEFILLREIVMGVSITRPALYIAQQINGNPEYTASPGDLLHYEISFKNIGETPLADLTLLVTLVGDGFDLQTLQAPRGEFKLGDNSVLWDWKRLGKLQFLDVMEEGNVEFWVKLKEDWEISSSQGEEFIKNRIYLSQTRTEFENKVNSKLEISQKGYFEDEIFGNSGFIPPKVGETTTYTIMWHTRNFFNHVKNVRMKAKLGKNVKLTGEIFPEEETSKFTFDSESREIVWQVGDMEVGKGVFNPPPNVSFQVTFTPDASQRGKTPKIIQEAEITGEDSWTRETLRFFADSIDTTLPDDQTVTEQMGLVQ
jgi:hypothetical protein